MVDETLSLSELLHMLSLIGILSLYIKKFNMTSRDNTNAGFIVFRKEDDSCTVTSSHLQHSSRPRHQHRRYQKSQV